MLTSAQCLNVYRCGQLIIRHTNGAWIPFLQAFEGFPASWALQPGFNDPNGSRWELVADDLSQIPPPRRGLLVIWEQPPQRYGSFRWVVI